MYIYDNISLIFPRIRNISDQVVAKIKTHILCSISFFSENCAIYEIMWKNMVEPDGPHDNSIWCMHMACWITKATDTHSEYEILIALLQQ